MSENTLARVIDSYTDAAMAATITEAAVQAAREAAKSGQSNAWDVARVIAADCESQEWSNSIKSDVFGLAAKAARAAFNEATGSDWMALASSASTLRGALLFGVPFHDLGKSVVSKAVNVSREAHNKGLLLSAVEAGILPAQSTPESLNAALTAELVLIKANYDQLKHTLECAQERLIPLDALKLVHESQLSEVNSKYAQALQGQSESRLELDALKSELDALKSVKPSQLSQAKPIKPKKSGSKVS